VAFSKGHWVKQKLMEIILIQDVDNLGGKNELVKVKNGYARNFLIPQGLAVEANPSNRKQLIERQKVAKKKEDAMLAQMASVIAKLNEGALKVGATRKATRLTVKKSPSPKK
jgi:large subunit ribosomal protein L9